MEIIYKNIEDIIPYANNPRHNENAIPLVAESIAQFGFKVPIVIDKNNVVVAGHTRLASAKTLNYKEVPCIVADDLTDDQIKAFRLADNKVAEAATWDIEKLDIELDEIQMDMSEFGFEDLELDEIELDVQSDDVPEAVETRCKNGDLWQLGNHRLICGDSTDTSVIERLMGGQS